VTVAWAFPLPWRWRSVGQRRLAAAGNPDITMGGIHHPQMVGLLRDLPHETNWMGILM